MSNQENKALQVFTRGNLMQGFTWGSWDASGGRAVNNSRKPLPYYRDKSRRWCYQCSGTGIVSGLWSRAGATEETQLLLEIHPNADRNGKCAWFLPPTLRSPSSSSHWPNLAGNQLTLEPRNTFCRGFTSQLHRAEQGKNEKWKWTQIGNSLEGKEKPLYRWRPALRSLVILKLCLSAIRLEFLPTLVRMVRSIH